MSRIIKLIIAITIAITLTAGFLYVKLNKERANQPEVQKTEQASVEEKKTVEQVAEELENDLSRYSNNSDAEARTTEEVVAELEADLKAQPAAPASEKSVEDVAKELESELKSK